jgi:hypothetical protein
MSPLHQNVPSVGGNPTNNEKNLLFDANLSEYDIEYVIFIQVTPRDE